jgi:hypothetical protein
MMPQDLLPVHMGVGIEGDVINELNYYLCGTKKCNYDSYKRIVMYPLSEQRFGKKWQVAKWDTTLAM